MAQVMQQIGNSELGADASERRPPTHANGERMGIARGGVNSPLWPSTTLSRAVKQIADRERPFGLGGFCGRALG